MKYQIDQSHKIEQTNKDTIIAVSNTIQFAIVLRGKDKRKIQDIFRSIGKPRNFVYFTFAALIALLLQKVDAKGRVIIDKEYIGHEKALYDRIVMYLKNTDFQNNITIDFQLVGKLSPAHVLAARVATRKEKPNVIISFKEVLEVIFPKEKDRASRKGPRTA